MIIPERINALIETIKASGRIRMASWQSRVDSETARSLKALHDCGNRACIGGHLALMPEFWAIGGDVGWTGAPVIRVGEAEYSRVEAVGYWLTERCDLFDISEEYKKIYYVVVGVFENSALYRWDEWGADEAVKALELLRDKPDLSLVEFDAELTRLLGGDLC